MKMSEVRYKRGQPKCATIDCSTRSAPGSTHCYDCNGRTDEDGNILVAKCATLDCSSLAALNSKHCLDCDGLTNVDGSVDPSDATGVFG